MNKKNIDKLISQAIAIEAEEADKSGTLAYMAKCLDKQTYRTETPEM